MNNNNEERKVYLTIDDGPSLITGKFLDILKKHNSHVTFFVVGTMILGKESIIERMAEDGHTIGVHTYTHKYDVIYNKPEAFWEDNLRTRKIITDIIGYEPQVMRFPGGSSNMVSRKYCRGIMSLLVEQAKDHGYEYFDWNYSPEDGSTDINSVDQMSELLVNYIHRNTAVPMILMHDRDQLVNHLEVVDRVLTQCISEGYSFEAISENVPPVHHRVNN